MALHLIDLEELDDAQLSKLQNAYEKIAAESRKQMSHQDDDTHVPHIELPGMGEAKKAASKPAAKRYKKRTARKKKV